MMLCCCVQRRAGSYPRFRREEHDSSTDLVDAAQCGRAYPRRVRKALPGDLVVRPVPVLAGVVLALNDHVLKAVFGDTVTGKLSDVSGLVFVPLLLLGILELGRAAWRRPWQIRHRDLVAALVLVGAALASAKLSVPISHGFGDVGGVLRYPFRGRFDAVTITHDPSDLWTLPALLIAWLDAAAVIRRRRSESRPQPCRRTASCGESASATVRRSSSSGSARGC
jgi:hypothetical protein